MSTSNLIDFSKPDIKALAEEPVAVEQPREGGKKILLELLDNEGVVGVDSDGPNIVIFVKSMAYAKTLPSSIDRKPVVIKVSGEIGLL
jgi:hypothetical protein